MILKGSSTRGKIVAVNSKTNQPIVAKKKKDEESEDEEMMTSSDKEVIKKHVSLSRGRGLQEVE